MNDTFTLSGEIITNHKGWIKWPWADVRYRGSLTVSRDALCLRAPLLGELRFAPDQVTVIMPHGKIPLLSWGIRISHAVESYPKRIVFRSLKRPKTLIDRIHAIGFLERGSEIEHCLQCGRPLSERKNYCSYCGWSYGNSES